MTDTLADPALPERTQAEARASARAWGWLLAWALATLVGVVVAVSPDPNPPFIPPPGATTDLEFFSGIVDRVRNGDSFHVATHGELRAHGYPSRSVFNWRTPTYAWLFATLPDGAWCRGALCLGMAVVVMLWSRLLLRDEGLWPATVGVLALIGATAWCVGERNYLFTELWAGMLIALSIALGRMEWRSAAVVVGISALFFRELALPYVLLAGWFAWREGRRREALGWALGTLAFFGFLGWHAWIVSGRLTPEDLPIAGGWIRLGGVRFILATSQTNVALMGLPLWATAVVLPLILVGLFRDSRDEDRLLVATVVGYLAAFSIVGAPFNYYWGFLIAPLLAIGLARAPRAFANTWREAIAGIMPGRLHQS